MFTPLGEHNRGLRIATMDDESTQESIRQGRLWDPIMPVDYVK